MGPTGQCINLPLREHFSSLKATKAGDLAICFGNSGCISRLEQAGVLQKLKEKRTRELAEVYYIKSVGEGFCINCPSLHLLGRDTDFLNRRRWHMLV